MSYAASLITGMGFVWLPLGDATALCTAKQWPGRRQKRLNETEMHVMALSLEASNELEVIGANKTRQAGGFDR